MKKISIFIDESGEIKYVEPRRKITTRGTMFSLPKPKIGRANHPHSQVIVTEHQYNKSGLAGQKKKDLDLMMDSEFSFARRKPDSRVGGLIRGNPNQVKRTTNKNKRNRRRK
jgi:hypothetical protein